MVESAQSRDRYFQAKLSPLKPSLVTEKPNIPPGEARVSQTLTPASERGSDLFLRNGDGAYPSATAAGIKSIFESVLDRVKPQDSRRTTEELNLGFD